MGLPGAVVGEDRKEVKTRRVDTRTRFQGVFARHRVSCGLAKGEGLCTCSPSYYGKAWDRSIHRQRRTKRCSRISEAKYLRDDLLTHLRSGQGPSGAAGGIRFEEAHRKFIEDCRAGVALNKRCRPYKPRAIGNLDSSLKFLPERVRRKALAAVTRGELQEAVDGFTREGVSSSRIASRINSTRSLYRWAEERGTITESPASRIRLPVTESRIRTRIVPPGEFAYLLNQLAPQDASPWALAAYGTARAQEIRALEWSEVDLGRRVLHLAADEEARKSEAARRLVPMVAPLRVRLEAEWRRQGRPRIGKVCPPRTRSSASGMLSLGQLSKRVKREWEERDLAPVGLQDSRHTAATWLDHAGVSPKVASAFMGHKTPRVSLYPDAAPITLRLYTHVLDGELERARDRLDRFLVDREEEERGWPYERPGSSLHFIPAFVP